MYPSDGPDLLEHPSDAAHWFARMQSREATEQDRQAFEAWLNADPEHGRQYRVHSYLWQAALALPERGLRSMMVPHDTPGKSGRGVSRRRFGLGLAGASALAAVGGLAVMTDAMRQPLDTLRLITRKGERRQFTLPDGSTLLLNTDTAAIMQFYEDQRHIELQHGEAFFQVQADAARPFVVDAGLGQVVVTGTRFNVRRDPQAMYVSVVAGSVRVRTGHWWNRDQHRLAAGQQANVERNQGLDEARHANVDDIVAWTRGKVVFNNAPLSYVIDEMNRYLAMPARLDAPQLAQYRISGVFSVDDPHAMINALPAIVPVRLDRKPDGRVRILPG